MITHPARLPPSRDSSLEFGRRMSRIGLAWRRAFDHDLQAFGLTEATWRPILLLGLLPPPVRQTDLARALDIEAGSLVRLLDQLEQRGLIARTNDPRDRRSKHVSVTQEGERIYRQVHDVCQAISTRLLGSISSEEQAICQSVFDRIEQSLSAGPGSPA